MPDNTDKVQAALSILMDAFYERYAAAQSWDDTTEHFTSSEIVDMFNNTYPIPSEDIFSDLIDHGFKCVPLAGQASFVWLLKQRQ